MLRRLLCTLAVMAAPAWGGINAPGATVLDYGYFCKLEAVGSAPAAGTLAGEVSLIPGLPEIAVQSFVVPARLGISFGLISDIDPALAGEISLRVTHPPMGAAGVTEQNWTSTHFAADPSYAGFTFDHEWERLTGEWTFTASANGRQIYTIAFTVVDPQSQPWLPCDPSVPLS